MMFRCWNRFDDCHFIYESEHGAGTRLNALDAVRHWNKRHGGYWEIGLPCIVDVEEVSQRCAA